MLEVFPASPETKHSRLLGREQPAWNRPVDQEEQTRSRHGRESHLRIQHLPSLHAALADASNDKGLWRNPGAFFLFGEIPPGNAHPLSSNVMNNRLFLKEYGKPKISRCVRYGIYHRLYPSFRGMRRAAQEDALENAIDMSSKSFF